MTQTKLHAKELDKYEELWSIPRFRHNDSPGEQAVETFIKLAKPIVGQTILDIGAGDGRACVELKTKGLIPTGFDITDSVWEPKDIPIVTGTAWKPIPVVGKFDYGYCCDMMEHIPQEYSALVISNMLAKCDKVFLTISFSKDEFGAFVGQTLHLNVQQFLWWRDMLREISTVHEAIDILGAGIFYIGR